MDVRRAVRCEIDHTCNQLTLTQQQAASSQLHFLHTHERTHTAPTTHPTSPPPTRYSPLPLHLCCLPRPSSLLPLLELTAPGTQEPPAGTPALHGSAGCLPAAGAGLQAPLPMHAPAARQATTKREERAGCGVLKDVKCDNGGKEQRQRLLKGCAAGSEGVRQVGK